MNLGIFLSAQYEPGSDLPARRVELDEQIDVAEALGFSTLSVGHHYLAKSAFVQPVPLAGYAAARTSRASILFGVYLLPLLNPLAVAEDFASLDVLSGGRIIAGVGAGYRKVEYRAFGVDYEDRFKLLENYIGILRALWSGEAVTAEGPFGALQDARLEITPLSPGGPPLWVGAFGDIGIRRAARLNAAWLGGPEGDDEELARRLGLYREALSAHGHSLDRVYPATRECAVAETREAALEAARPHLRRQYEGYRSWDDAQRLDLDEFIETHCLVGTSEDVLTRLEHLHSRHGITDVILRVQWMGMPNEQVMRTIHLLGTKVLPEVTRWS